ncbi:arylformamidase [Ruminococcaceae bacterium YRB3002]|nr:arylformamidase [Ruminococcaceae bacterium YRB3002]
MIIDISQEVFGCAVFPGDPSPAGKRIMSIADGDVCNLTSIEMCAHNGTHVDSPFHFYNDGKTIDEVPLDKFVGPCYVAEHNGDVTASDADGILVRARNAGSSAERILLKGKCTVTEGAAGVFAGNNVKLIGNESQTVGPEDAPAAVHYILLKAEVVLLEGIRLTDVPEGAYYLCAQPLNLAGIDGAPCRAILITEQ